MIIHGLYIMGGESLKVKALAHLKGSVSYVTEEPIFDDMKNGWLDKKYPGHAAVVIHMQEVYSGAEKLA